MTSSDSEGTPGQPDQNLPPTHQPYGQPPPPQPGYGQVPYGQVPYGQQPPGQAPYGYPAYPQPVPPTEGLGLASMIVGIASLVLMCLYGIGLLGSPVALVMGRVSMKRIDRSQGQLGGRGMAQAGFILGIIGTVLLVLVIAAVVVLVVIGLNGGFDDSGSGTTTYNS